MDIMLNEILELYMELFDVDIFRKVQINYFDKKEDFRNYIYELRGENDSLPEYAVGTFEKEYELNDGFREWFTKVKSETKEIPELNNLSHGFSFKTDKYNGYDLSLLAVKNLYDRLGFDGIKMLLRNSNSVLRRGYGIIEESFLFYGIEFQSIKSK